MKVDKRIVYTIISIMIVISGLIGYSYINSDLNSSSSVTVNKYNCNQSNLYDRLACMSVMDNVKSKYVSSDMGIDFSNVSSDTNGKGIYTFSSTAGDEYPVYYYRGAVEDNNVKFAGFCWKIVRTTSTGGTKLIYNGEPDENGYCNKSGSDTIINTSPYNLAINSLAYLGYMYGEVYESYNMNIDDTYVYGNSFSFIDEDTNISGDGTYTLNNKNSIDNDNHYTCLNDSGVCSEIAYVYYKNSQKIYYILIRDGKNIETAIQEMKTNTNDSKIKEVIDEWYKNEINSYTSQIEDTIWCDDRSESMDTQFINEFNSGWNPNGGKLEVHYWTQGYIRRQRLYKPSINCSEKNDAFTVSDLINGNGNLKYPVGLLTSDEVLIAGSVNIDYENPYYLKNEIEYWLINPIRFMEKDVNHSRVMNNGRLSSMTSNKEFGVRPSISLNHSQVISSGDGTKNNPYVIE